MTQQGICNQNVCRGGLECCVELPGSETGYYCDVASQCKNQPYWEIILIPILLGVAALIIAVLICCKLKKKQKKKFNVNYFSHQQIRVKPVPKQIQNITYTTLRSSQPMIPPK